MLCSASLLAIAAGRKTSRLSVSPLIGGRTGGPLVLTDAFPFLLLHTRTYARITRDSLSTVGWELVADVTCRPSWDKPIEVTHC